MRNRSAFTLLKNSDLHHFSKKSRIFSLTILFQYVILHCEMSIPSIETEKINLKKCITNK